MLRVGTSTELVGPSGASVSLPLGLVSGVQVRRFLRSFNIIKKGLQSSYQWISLIDYDLLIISLGIAILTNIIGNITIHER